MYWPSTVSHLLFDICCIFHTPDNSTHLHLSFVILVLLSVAISHWLSYTVQLCGAIFHWLSYIVQLNGSIFHRLLVRYNSVVPFSTG